MVRVALFGAGNSGRAFVEAVKRYSAKPDEGLWHKKVGGLHVKDLSVEAVFDVDGEKVGRSLGDVEIKAGLMLDEPPRQLTPKGFKTADEASLKKELEKANVDVALNVISSGQDKTSKTYAEICGQLGIAFANATPALVANDRALQKLFRDKGVPLAGDDLLSQLGGTMLHKGILDFLHSRGIRIVKSYQLDVGGSMDTLNTIRDDIRAFKRSVKSKAIAEELPYKVDTVAGTTDFVEFMGAKRTVYLWIVGKGPMDEPYVMDVFFKSSDPVNAVNVLLDVSRALYSRKGRGGVDDVISSYAFKNPPRPLVAKEAMAAFERAFLG